MIQAVLFDLFETLITEAGLPVRRASSLAAELGVNEDAYRQLWRSRRRDIVLGRASFRDTLAQIVRTLGSPPDDRVVEHLRSERMEQKIGALRTVNSDILSALGALRAQKLQLAVVSNCFAEDVSGWDSSPLRSFFDVAVFSYAARVAKPDPEIYLLACRNLHVRPESALFVGDGGDDELAGARSAGLRAARALWFVSGAATRSFAPDDPALLHATDVLDAAMSA